MLHRTALAFGSALLLASPVYAQARPPIDAACAVLVTIDPATSTLTLPAGATRFHDSLNGGLPSLPLSTNPIGPTAADFDELIGFASANERIMRIHVVNGPFLPASFAGEARC